MSASVLYHGFGLRGYEHVRTESRSGRLVFRLRRSVERLVCSACGSREVVRRGTVEREFRTVPIGRKPVVLGLPVQRLACRRCQALRQARLGFADPRKHYSRAFERYALELLRHATIKSVAGHRQVSWDVVKKIQKRHLQRRFGRPKLKRVRRLMVDELYLGKGNRYLTLVVDWETGAVLFVGDGRGGDALLPFWKRLRASHAQVEAIAMDMSPAYVEAITKHLPGARIVFDRFHVLKLYNEKLSDLRRDLQRALPESEERKVLKGTRWLLLKNPEHLDEQRNERARLEEALALNLPLATAYYLKEDLRRFWDQPDKATAQSFLEDWIARAEVSAIQMLGKFAKTLAGHRTGLLAYYDFPLSTGPLEGLNNKIRTVQRQAYGFRDHEFLKLRILGLHETKYALVG